jgi:murein DD-endopeptidase MepM/ murein hydrolase activator NlpD
MGKSIFPGTWLYAGTGAFIGIFATVLVPQAGVSHLTISRAPLSLTSLAPDFAPAPADTDPATWTESVRGVLRAALGLAVETVTVEKGDTLADVLMKTGIDKTTVQHVVDAVHDVFNPKRLQVGQELELGYDVVDADGNANPLSTVNFEIDAERSVSVARQEDGTFTAKEIIASTRREFVRSEGEIKSTLFEAAQAQNIPIDVMAAMVKIFSYDVDFQRDIQKGDTFQLMYERTATEEGRAVRNLNIRYAAMTLSGTPMKFYAFRQEDGTYEYYNDKGEGVRKALLRTPVNGAVLTSGFGMRRHPVLGYSLMHRGVDFGAPTGTPIMAAGDGVIEKRDSGGSYGNYLRVRHQGGYATAYAHMSRFGDGMSVGKRVRQGQIIGYVGTTGRSTGPHLHFEVHKGNGQVNPNTVKFPASAKLEGALMTKFRAIQADVDKTYAALEVSTNIAQAADAEPEADAEKN